MSGPVDHPIGTVRLPDVDMDASVTFVVGRMRPFFSLPATIPAYSLELELTDPAGPVPGCPAGEDCQDDGCDGHRPRRLLLHDPDIAADLRSAIATEWDLHLSTDDLAMLEQLVGPALQGYRIVVEARASQ